jgi:DNA-binding transcriptional ArsR family regulator
MSSDEIGKSETADQMRLSHEHYLSIVNNPVRKTILEALCKGNLTVEDLQAITNLSMEALSWHLSILETGTFACIEKETQPGHVVFKLTKAGKVINYLK